MTVEVRQMVIRSTVDPNEPDHSSHGGEAGVTEFERLKAEILAECRDMVRETLQAQMER